MRRFPALAALLSWVVLCGCTAPGPPRSRRSFDQIRSLVAGRTASEVAELLGPPDAQETVSRGERRWIWWRFTFLEGEQYAATVRGKVVHLLVVLGPPETSANGRAPLASWRVRDPYAVSYALAAATGR